PDGASVHLESEPENERLLPFETEASAAALRLHRRDQRGCIDDGRTAVRVRHQTALRFPERAIAVEGGRADHGPGMGPDPANLDRGRYVHQVAIGAHNDRLRVAMPRVDTVLAPSHGGFPPA